MMWRSSHAATRTASAQDMSIDAAHPAQIKWRRMGVQEMRNLISCLRPWRRGAKPSRALLICASLAAGAASLSSEPARAAEFGTGPWVKGYTDILGGIVPPVPGFYFRTDAYHYNGDAERTIFNGFVQASVEEDYTATIAALTYVTPWKILGGTYAVADVHRVDAIFVDVALGMPKFSRPNGGRTI
jgi:hypothetical protein